MQPYICGRFFDGYLIADRFGSQAAKINERKYFELVNLSENKDAEAPPWLISILSSLGQKMKVDAVISDLVQLKRRGTCSFAKASYEITEACNFRCEHCYLGEKKNKTLEVDKKKRILDLIDQAGCFWLQITGGEPLADRDFESVYKYAYALGFLIVLSSNGSLLTAPRITEILEQYPPWRLTVSLYGATNNSYEELTHVRSSATKVFAGLEWASKRRQRVRLNLIVTKYNKHEVDQMIGIAKGFNFDYHVFENLTPALDGSRLPLVVAVDESCREKDCHDVAMASSASGLRCHAGETFFHVDSKGAMSICKLSRWPKVDLLASGIEGFKQLPVIAKQSLKKPTECQKCTIKSECETCAPKLALYKIGGDIPASVCRRRS